LANGATLVLARQETLASGRDLLDLLVDQAITTVTLPPSVLRLFSANQVSRFALPALETVISAGEACSPEIIAIWAPDREFFNAYGPTETTVCASMYRCTGDEEGIPPIGRPIANTKLYILDKNLQSLPVGIPGELHISGVSLATGYRNQPQISAQKFIKNPFTEIPDGAPLAIESQSLPTWYDQMYKTGDLVRYRRDGNIEFLGRIDYQVKVRGFRIELGEIEVALEKDHQVKEAVVIAQGGSLGDKRLAAFINGHPGQVVDLNEVKHNLRKILPEYMVPTSFIALEEMPLTPSGKIDRKKLEEMQITDRPDLSSQFVPPRNEIERRLVDICADLLRIEKVGVYDNFFELGGHSLLATQFVSRVRDEYNVDLPLKELFESPTVASIAEYVQEQQAKIQQDEQTGKAIDRAKLLEMMKRIGELSEDEVKTLLEQKRKLMG
jgi:acyl-coenzyme A synthetase/AMP-(fatty) acid ligase/acyl carrier protein